MGDYGAIVTSTDQGHSWIQLNSGTDSWLRGVLWSGSQYIVVGSSNTILTSLDGTTWTSRLSPPAGSDIWFSAVASSGNGFVAVGLDHGRDLNNVIFNSSDGIHWSENTYVFHGEIFSVIWANNQYVAVGLANNSPMILTSSDGLSWTDRSNSINVAIGLYLRDITWTGSKYVAVGLCLTASSSDGITWTVNDKISWIPTAVVWSGHKLMAASGYGGIYSSTDGLNWTPVFEGSDRLGSIAWSGSQYVGVGKYPPIILVSPY